MASAKFNIGQIIHHNRFDYRGVIVDVDATFSASDEWYDKVALSRPPKDKPWYRVLVDGTDEVTYVAERHLEPDEKTSPIKHPLVDELFDGYENGQYVKRIH